MEKICSIPSKTHKHLIKTAVTLFVILSDPAVPVIAKSAIVISLGYLISPIDLIPDFLIPLGLTDDAAVLATTLMQLDFYNTDSVKKRVDEILASWKIVL